MLYFRDMKGHGTGPASAAYLYYKDTDKSWAAPLAIGIAP